MDFLSTSSAVAGHIGLQTVAVTAELLKRSVREPEDLCRQGSGVPFLRFGETVEESRLPPGLRLLDVKMGECSLLNENAA